MQAPQFLKKLVWFTGLSLASFSALAQSSGEVLNLYSARHYSTDEALYNNFTKKTGIAIKRLELGDEPLLERLRNEGKRSPADVVLLVDAARIAKAESEGLFQPTGSKYLKENIPDQFQGGNDMWYAFSSRSRVIVYNKASVNANLVQNYEDLAKPELKGKVCTRSGGHPYMLSLMSAMINHLGEAGATQWASGMVANMARPPKGGDTDQIKGVASGECGVALTNTYYFVRLLRSDKPEDKDIISKVGFVWPNQKSYGAHMNVSAGAIAANAPNKEAAVKFLEYLATPEAQQYFANGNNEWPTAKGVKVSNPAIESLGTFKADLTPARILAANTATSQKIMDKVGYK